MSKANKQNSVPFGTGQSFSLSKGVIMSKFFPIVGIGASAGGLEATTQLLKSLPTDLGMGFVLVQHLDPTHESILADLLSKATTMAVNEAEDKTPVKPNQVYVIPHNKDMTIINGVLKLTTRHKGDKLHMPIDQFFTSLAQSHQNKAIGVVLSGTATDGTLGLKMIKNAGGITFAQNETAKYQGMPKSAIASGAVDFVLAPSGIAKELTKMNKHPYSQKSSAYIQQPKTESPDEREFPEDKDELTKIFFMLNKSFGIDFRHYKEAMIKRRISRRMHLSRSRTLKDYVDILKEDNDEMDSLQDDLLINVTSFFRELPTFQFLNDTVFPRLVKNKSPQDPIRVWVPGCATGEEVYSIAIALSECLTNMSLNIPVQIFGTDASKTAIKKARLGIYSQKDVDGISPKRLALFFEKRDESYQISKSIRELCIFAPHNVCVDPPFSRLDLISCCNLLIYLDLSLQKRILQAFHYAFKPGGILMLGKSETVGAFPELFSQIDKKYRIYARKDTAARGVVGFGITAPKLESQDASDAHVISETVIDSFDIQKEADMILLSHYTPASVVINNDLEIIQFRGSTGAYLEPSPGKASFNLIKMAREDLGFELRNAVSKAKKNGNPFRKENISVRQNGVLQHVTIEVLPLKSSRTEDYSQENSSHYLVLFENIREIPSKNITNRRVSHLKRETRDRRIVQLEQELAQTREDMRSISEEHEATTEELQTASEEILSSNEELQTINEELETSKEELESTNEELVTVNEELQNRNEQMTDSRDFAEAIIQTVHVPLLILDQNLRVKTANRFFRQVFQVAEEETTGKFIYDLGNGQWDIPALRILLHEILPKNNVFDNYELEHIFPSIGHKIMLLNARRFYKGGENILLAIEDITDRRVTEKHKDLFIGIASHELKTPITTIKGYAQILEKRLLQRRNIKDIYLMQNIIKQTDRLTSLINDLLNTSLIQSGKLVLKKKRFDLNAVVAKAVVDFQYSTETHQIIKEGEIIELVSGDQSRIEQVLANLITNAIKYSPKTDEQSSSTNKVIVRVGTDKQRLPSDKVKNYAIVSVQDFGFGIDKREQAKVFERFYRTSDKKAMNVAGFGLGLYITAEIIKSHHGRIWLESTKHKGSTFYFSLPIK